MKKQAIMWLVAVMVAVLAAGCGQKHQTKEWKTDADIIWVSAIESDEYVENDSCKGFAYLEVDTSSTFNRMALIIPIDTTKKEVPDITTRLYNLGDFNLVVNGKCYKAYCTYGYDYIPPFTLSYLFVHENNWHDKVSRPSGDNIRVEVEQGGKIIYSFGFYPTPSTSTP